MSKKPQAICLSSSFAQRHPVVPRSEFHDFLTKLHHVRSSAIVRPLVIPTGRRARGQCSARKVIGRATYESLLECQVWKILDAAGMVSSFLSHPVVLQLKNDQGLCFRYTPDAIVRVGTSAKSQGFILEVKAKYFLTQHSSRERIQTIARALRKAGLNYALVLDSDLQPELLDALNSLWIQRPAVGPWSPKLDLNAWDPRALRTGTSRNSDAWKKAQNQCDSLLSRVMQRNPDDLDGIMSEA